MENKIAISFDLEQVAAALEDAGFEVSERNVADVVEYINNGGEIVEDFDAAFRTLIADAATDLKIRKAYQPFSQGESSMAKNAKDVFRAVITAWIDGLVRDADDALLLELIPEITTTIRCYACNQQSRQMLATKGQVLSLREGVYGPPDKVKADGDVSKSATLSKIYTSDYDSGLRDAWNARHPNQPIARDPV